MNLGLDDEVVPADLAGHGLGFFRRVGNLARAGGDAVFLEEFLGLVFVDVHVRGDKRGKACNGNGERRRVGRRPGPKRGIAR